MATWAIKQNKYEGNSFALRSAHVDSLYEKPLLNLPFT